MGEEPCNTSLSLGRGGFADAAAAAAFLSWERGREEKQPVRFHTLFPPCPKEEKDGEGGMLAGEEQGTMTTRLRLWTAKEERDVIGADAHEVGGGDGQVEGNARKKLCLTRGQLMLLERSFRQNDTLTATEKQELADELNLRPRQVEVWFQNKRARTKLKQTEVECEFLKKCCESLSDENQRLKEELRELRSSKQGLPFYIQLPQTAKLAMCPSCERVAASGGSAARIDSSAARGNVRSRAAPSNTGSMSCLGDLRQKYL